MITCLVPDDDNKNHYILVTGGRTYDDVETVFDVLNFAHMFYGEHLRLIHGGAKGLDTIAGDVCDQLGIKYRVYPADWNKHGKPAGFIRNTEMVKNLVRWRDEHGHSVQVISFPGGKGTANCSRTAESAGLTVDYIPVVTRRKV